MTVQLIVTIFATSISFLSLCFAVWIGLRGSKRTDTKDIEDRAKANANINFKLDVISTTTREIKRDVDRVMDDVKGVDRRLIIVEQSSKSAHKRLDLMEKALSIRKEDLHEDYHQAVD